MPHIKNALIRYRIIDRCLRNKYRPFPTKRDLREACEEALYGSVDGANICDSTIEKDMFAMKMEHDAPIRYSKRHSGYYYEDPDFSRQEEFSHLVQFETAVSSGGNEFIPELFEAIKGSRMVSFEYTSFLSGKSKNRVVLPLMLKEYRNRWYLITHDPSRNDIITYGLDRMSKPEVLEETSVKPEDFDPFSYFRYAIGITSNKSEPVNMIFKADNVAAKYINSQPLHPNQEVVKEGKNRTTFQMTVLISEELIRNLLSYGGEIEVLEPESLRNAISERVRRMLSNYGLS
jgi:predicted DNA-binding transcriptional regulator YafY